MPNQPLKSVTREVIEASTDDELVGIVLWEYITAHVELASRGGGELAYRAEVARLPRGLRYAYRLTVFQGDVPNGGLSQWFDNNTPVEVAETLDMFEAIGATASVKALETALDLARTRHGFPDGSKMRWFADRQFDDELHSLDPPLWEQAAMATDYALLTAWIRRNIVECLHSR